MVKFDITFDLVKFRNGSGAAVATYGGKSASAVFSSVDDAEIAISFADENVGRIIDAGGDADILGGESSDGRGCLLVGGIAGGSRTVCFEKKISAETAENFFYSVVDLIIGVEEI